MKQRKVVIVSKEEVESFPSIEAKLTEIALLHKPHLILLRASPDDLDLIVLWDIRHVPDDQKHLYSIDKDKP